MIENERLKQIKCLLDKGEIGCEEARRLAISVCTNAVNFAWKSLCAAQLILADDSEIVKQAIHEAIVALEAIENKMKEVG